MPMLRVDVCADLASAQALAQALATQLPNLTVKILQTSVISLNDSLSPQGTSPIANGTGTCILQSPTAAVVLSSDDPAL